MEKLPADLENLQLSNATNRLQSFEAPQHNASPTEFHLSFDVLPDEICEKVVHYLDPKTAKSWVLVNKRLCGIGQRAFPWKLTWDGCKHEDASSFQNVINTRFIASFDLMAGGQTLPEQLFSWLVTVSHRFQKTETVCIRRAHHFSSLLPLMQRMGALNTLVIKIPLNLANLTQLQSLDLSPLATLTQLQTLDLSGTQVRDLSPLAPLTQLQSLHLGGTPVSDLSPLAPCTQLQSLHLGFTQVSNHDVSALRSTLPHCSIISWKK